MPVDRIFRRLLLEAVDEAEMMAGTCSTICGMAWTSPFARFTTICTPVQLRQPGRERRDDGGDDLRDGCGDGGQAGDDALQESVEQVMPADMSTERADEAGHEGGDERDRHRRARAGARTGWRRWCR